MGGDSIHARGSGRGGAPGRPPQRARRRRRWRRRQSRLLAPRLAAGPARGVASRKRAEERSSRVSPSPRPRALRAARAGPAPALPHPGAPCSGRGRGAGAGRAVHLPGGAGGGARPPPLGLGQRCAPRARRGGRGGAAPVPAPFNFAAAAAPRAGGRRRGRSYSRIPHEVWTRPSLLPLSSARLTRASWTARPGRSCGARWVLRARHRGRGKALPGGVRCEQGRLSRVEDSEREEGTARAPGGSGTGALATAWGPLWGHAPWGPGGFGERHSGLCAGRGALLIVGRLQRAGGVQVWGVSGKKTG